MVAAALWLVAGLAAVSSAMLFVVALDADINQSRPLRTVLVTTAAVAALVVMMAALYSIEPEPPDPGKRDSARVVVEEGT